jgi:hypothetical protein
VIEVLLKIVDRGQVTVRVLGGDQLADPVPVRCGLGNDQVVFVGQGPPNIGVPGQPPHHVPHHPVVHRRTQVGETPPVVRVEQDEVRLYPQSAEGANLLVELGEELDIETREVQLAIRATNERDPLRFGPVVEEVLGKQAHP